MNIKACEFSNLLNVFQSHFKMAYNSKTRILLLFLLYILQVYAGDRMAGKVRYLEEQLTGNKNEQDILSTAQNDKMMDKLIKSILKEKALENLKDSIMNEVNIQIKTLRETVESQNILIDQLVKRMTEKESVIEELSNRLKLHEESHERMPQKVHIDQHEDETSTDTNSENEVDETSMVNTSREKREKLTENISSLRNHKTFNGELKRSQLLGVNTAPMTKVAFSVYLSDKVTKETDLDNFVIKFDGIILNEGSMYNKYTGVYTAPVSGIYHLNFHCSASWDGLIFPTLMKNGQKVVSTILNPQKSTINGSNSALMFLNTGDSLWIEMFAGIPTGVELNSKLPYPDTTFSGFLLYH